MSLLSVVLGIKYQQSVTTACPKSDSECPILDEAPSSGYKPAELCNKTQCLFERLDQIEGYTTVKGYYRPYEYVGWGNAKVICDSFEIVNGTPIVLVHFRNLIDIGNTVNVLNPQGNLMLKINLKDLTINDQIKLKASSSGNLLELLILLPKLPQTEVGDCGSVVNLIGIRQ